MAKKRKAVKRTKKTVKRSTKRKAVKKTSRRR